MPTKSKSSPKPTPKPLKALSPQKPNRVRLILIILGALVVGFFIYRFITVQIDKHNFRKAETAIEEVSKEISKAFPTKLTKACLRPHTGYNDSPLQCSAGIEYRTPYIDQAHAQAVRKVFDSAITTNKSFRESQPYDSQQEAEVIHRILTVVGTKPHISCTSLYQKVDSSNEYTATLVCTIKPRFAIY